MGGILPSKLIVRNFFLNFKNFHLKLCFTLIDETFRIKQKSPIISRSFQNKKQVWQTLVLHQYQGQLIIKFLPCQKSIQISRFESPKINYVLYIVAPWGGGPPLWVRRISWSLPDCCRRWFKDCSRASLTAMVVVEGTSCLWSKRFLWKKVLWFEDLRFHGLFWLDRRDHALKGETKNQLRPRCGFGLTTPWMNLYIS